MNWDQIEGKWKQFTGSARERWGKLTDDDWQTIGGKKDQLIGRIQERYGIARAEAEKQADEWSRALKQSNADKELAGRLSRPLRYGKAKHMKFNRVISSGCAVLAPWNAAPAFTASMRSRAKRKSRKPGRSNSHSPSSSTPSSLSRQAQPQQQQGGSDATSSAAKPQQRPSGKLAQRQQRSRVNSRLAQRRPQAAKAASVAQQAQTAERSKPSAAAACRGQRSVSQSQRSPAQRISKRPSKRRPSARRPATPLLCATRQQAQNLATSRAVGATDGAWQGHASWQQDRSSNWQADHRTWAQRGGYGGYYIPQASFSLHFGVGTLVSHPEPARHRGGLSRASSTAAIRS